jgi:8-oxo-dGTP diphosphatase
MPGVPDDPELSRRTGRGAITPTIVVTAAVVCRDDCFLVTRRPRGVHLEGLWEFPGGKCLPGEPLVECLLRELREELDIEPEIVGEIHVVTHRYSDRNVELHFFECRLAGEPRPQLGQDMQWVRRGELHTLEFPPADAELIELLVNRQ